MDNLDPLHILACEGNFKSHDIPVSSLLSLKASDLNIILSTSHCKMGLGILEDRVMEHVPGLSSMVYSLEGLPLTLIKGTTRYFDDPERPQIAREGITGLKCDTSGPVPIILVPQPSDDPNDPLVCLDFL